MPVLDAVTTARLLRELSQRATLAGGNPYRARAYARAAESLGALTVPLDRIVAEGKLREIPGVGEAIADIIEQLHRTGSHPALEKLRQEVPPGVLEMLRIPGLRPEKVTKLHSELGISSLAQLEEAARSDRLKGVKAIGPVLQRKILEGIDIARRTSGSRHIHRAAELLALAEKDLARADPSLARITPAGDFRRAAELVFDLALVAEAKRLPAGPQVIKHGEVAIHLTDGPRFGATLLLATGSEAHLRDLRVFAEGKDFTLTGAGLRRGDAIVAARDEADIYAALGLDFIPPELREGRGEVAAAAAHRLPVLVEPSDIRGIVHAHTVASDGVNTLAQMAEATRRRGYGYFGVADHSQSAGYAGGLSVEEIEQQHAEVDRLNADYGGEFRVFKGIESDILADGSLDYPDEVLQRFDFIVASVHSGFRADVATQTARIVRAVSNPRTTILGHMTGRQLLRRDGYEVDVEQILAACAEHGVAVEINANPWRLDVDWRWHQRGLELGCMFSINPDAHSTTEIDLERWGVAMARKGGLAKENVLNCLTADALAARLDARARKAPPGKRPRARASPARRKAD
jgi:DNA polymerase (family X)